MSDQPSAIKRPFRSTAIAFAVMVTFFVVCFALFADFSDPQSMDPLEWVKATLFVSSYCLFLAFFATGMVLAAENRLMKWWWRLLFVPILMTAGIWLIIQLMVNTDIRSVVQISPPVFGVAVRVSLFTLIAYLFFGCVVAGSGWVGFYRGRRKPESVAIEAHIQEPRTQ